VYQEVSSANGRRGKQAALSVDKLLKIMLYSFGHNTALTVQMKSETKQTDASVLGTLSKFIPIHTT